MTCHQKPRPCRLSAKLIPATLERRFLYEERLDGYRTEVEAGGRVYPVFLHRERWGWTSKHWPSGYCYGVRDWDTAAVAHGAAALPATHHPSRKAALAALRKHLTHLDGHASRVIAALEHGDPSSWPCRPATTERDR